MHTIAALLLKMNMFLFFYLMSQCTGLLARLQGINMSFIYLLTGGPIPIPSTHLANLIYSVLSALLRAFAASRLQGPAHSATTYHTYFK